MTKFESHNTVMWCNICAVCTKQILSIAKLHKNNTAHIVQFAQHIQCYHDPGYISRTRPPNVVRIYSYSSVKPSVYVVGCNIILCRCLL